MCAFFGTKSILTQKIKLDDQFFLEVLQALYLGFVHIPGIGPYVIFHGNPSWKEIKSLGSRVTILQCNFNSFTEGRKEYTIEERML